MTHDKKRWFSSADWFTGEIKPVIVTPYGIKIEAMEMQKRSTYITARSKL